MYNKIAKNQAISWESFIVLSLLLLMLFLIFPDFAFAGTGGSTELKAIYDKTEGMITGYGGKLIAALAFAFGAVGAIKGNPWVFVPGFGTAMVVGVGPTIFTSGVSALI